MLEWILVFKFFFVSMWINILMHVVTNYRVNYLKHLVALIITRLHRKWIRNKNNFVTILSTWLHKNGVLTNKHVSVIFIIYGHFALGLIFVSDWQCYPNEIVTLNLGHVQQNMKNYFELFLIIEVIVKNPQTVYGR